MDACFQCKLCEVECPYTPRSGHEFQLDFPKLVHRFQALHRQDEEPTLRDKVLADPDGSAAFARLSFGLANAMNKVPAHRLMMEKVLGIHRDKQLPDFAQQTFERWADEHDKIKTLSPEHKPEAVLFQTCYVQNNEPQIGQDVLAVMEQNKVDVACVEGLGCCGMPAWERGDLAGVRERAKRNLDVLMPWVEAGAQGDGRQPHLLDDDEVASIPSCSRGGTASGRSGCRRRCATPVSSCGVSATSRASAPTSRARRARRSRTTRPVTCGPSEWASRAAISCARSRA
jgi:Fe-S oxidoreductase